MQEKVKEWTSLIFHDGGVASRAVAVQEANSVLGVGAERPIKAVTMILIPIAREQPKQ